MSLSFLRSYFAHPRTASRPLGPLRRYLRWQYTSRILRRPLQFPFVNNTVLEARRGWHAVSACYYFGLPEYEAMSFLGHLLRPGDLFCDVGAHAGTYSVLATAVGADVIAIEPNPEAVAYLQDHITMNQLAEGIQVVGSAAGARSAMVSLTVSGQQSHVISRTNPHGIQVKQIALDSVTSGRHPVAIKIDVEGYEGKVLAGGQRTLENTELKAICIETMGLSGRYDDHDDTVLELLYRHGFQRIDFNPAKRIVSLSDKRKGMSVLVRDIDWVKDRVQRAPRLRLAGK